MHLLLPTPAPMDEGFWAETWPQFQRRAPLPPFADVSLQFLDTFSKRILLDPALRQDAAFAALAHWARRAHLQAYRPHGGAAARGLVLHLSPANVDTLFAFSWFTSLLCGNLNVVRVSSRSLQAIAPLQQTLASLLAEPAFTAIRERTLVVSYDHDAALTARLSAGVHARLIWGGDETVAAIRAIPLPAFATEIAFADRFSLAAFKATHVTALDSSALQRLAENLFNDAYQFGQKACASPRVVAFTGAAAERDAAAARFWPALLQIAGQRARNFGEADGITRLASAMAIAADLPDARVTVRPSDGTPLLVLQTATWTEAVRARHDGAGLFVQLDLTSLEELAPKLSPRDQTLVVAGYGPAEIAGLVGALPARSLDRIVAPGHALDFDPTAWDGQNLFRLLTREIALPSP